MTNPLYWLVTITDRRSTDAFLALYESYGVRVSLRTVGAGTAVQEMLATLGLEKSEKAVLFAIITADTWPKIQKALRRQMRIDVPGTGIAFIIPVSSMGGKRALQFLTEHQTFTRMEESTLKDTHYELLPVIANQGYTASIMDAWPGLTPRRALSSSPCRSPTRQACGCWTRTRPKPCKPFTCTMSKNPHRAGRSSLPGRGFFCRFPVS